MGHSAMADVCKYSLGEELRSLWDKISATVTTAIGD